MQHSKWDREVNMSGRTFVGSPLNVADQGAYENTFLHASQLDWQPLQGERAQLA